MKTLGAVLIVLGLLVSLVGYGSYGNVLCHCPAQTTNHFACPCTGVLQNTLGSVLVSLGLVVAGSGMFIFMKWWRKKIIFNER